MTKRNNKARNILRRLNVTDCNEDRVLTTIDKAIERGAFKQVSEREVTHPLTGNQRYKLNTVYGYWTFSS